MTNLLFTKLKKINNKYQSQLETKNNAHIFDQIKNGVKKNMRQYKPQKKKILLRTTGFAVVK